MTASPVAPSTTWAIPSPADPATSHVHDHDPTHGDIEAFFRRFHAALKARDLAFKGITTDGSTLYPGPIATVFGDVPHQLCTFHVLKEVTKAVLGAVAKLRKGLESEAPKLGRGRPSKAARCAARRKARIGRKVGDLFEHRYLFVRHHLADYLGADHPRSAAIPGPA